uniref:Uncharacterized protein n=1 Tax=Oryza nivara TaxID=4536 RepID=A0A0E0J026_ORYNI
MESGTRDVSDSNTTDPVQDQRVGAVDPVVAIDPVSVEAAAMDHAVIIVDAGQTSCELLNYEPWKCTCWKFILNLYPYS